MPLEGVDFSSTGTGDWHALAAALKASGKEFAGVYLVSDKSPGGRGISAAEYQAFKAAQLDIFAYWEGAAEWMLGGYAAGVVAAVNAEQNRTAAGIPPLPIHFAHDIDPEPQHFQAIRECVEGAASVVGWDRMGVYGGWLLIDHLAPIYDKMRYYCQTLAWEYGRGVHPRATLYQYGFNAWIGNTNCDLVRAYQDDYGQASLHETPEPEPSPYAAPEVPAWFTRSVKSARPADADVDGIRWHVCRRNVEAIGRTYRYSRSDIKSPKAGPPVAVREKLQIERVFVGKDKRQWFVCADGCYVVAAKFTPRIQIRPR